jgi:hypothetical protein
VHRARDKNMVVTSSDAVLPLVMPEQGGEIILVAARVRNLDACSVTILGEVHDTCAPDRTFTAEMKADLTVGSDGWAEPRLPMSPVDYLNIPMCPQVDNDRDIFGSPFLLKVTAQDGQGRSASASLTISMECDPSDGTCFCECRRGYAMGAQCPDASVSSDDASCH